MPLRLQPVHVGGATLVGEAFLLAVLAVQMARLGPLDVNILERRSTPDDLLQATGEEHGVRIHFHNPVVLSIVVHFNHLQPDLVEDISVQGRVPATPQRHEEGDGLAIGTCDLVHWEGKGIAVGHHGLVAEHRPLVTLEDANSSLLLLQEQSCFVPEGHHQGPAVQADLSLERLLVHPSFDLVLLHDLHLLLELLRLQLVLQPLLFRLLLRKDRLLLCRQLFFEDLLCALCFFLGFFLKFLELILQLLLAQVIPLLQQLCHGRLLGLCVLVEGLRTILVGVHLAGVLVNVTTLFHELPQQRVGIHVFVFRVGLVMLLQRLGLLRRHLLTLGVLPPIVEQIEEVEQRAARRLGLHLLHRFCPESALRLLLLFPKPALSCFIQLVLDFSEPHAELGTGFIPDLLGHLRQRSFLSSLEGGVRIFRLRLLPGPQGHEQGQDQAQEAHDGH
mmetsp:Transcript_109432/g.261022  ORF Transcript_109432/g.261022 Transcript_109432/m.261022 type:complete len:446 (+) Transcript_109432:117-1454(+)